MKNNCIVIVNDCMSDACSTRTAGEAGGFMKFLRQMLVTGAEQPCKIQGIMVIFSKPVQKAVQLIKTLMI
ncbi:MAG: hypothetical protein ACP5QA_15980 [Phycisphaerae bacterium]